MASQQDINKEIALLKQQAELRQQINGSLEAYNKAVSDSVNYQKTILANDKILADMQAKLATARRNNDIAEAKRLEVKIKALGKITDELRDQQRILDETLRDANVATMTLASATAGMVKGFGKLPGLLKGSFGKIKGWGLFDLDKSIKQATLEMGLLGTQATNFNETLRRTSKITNTLGVNVDVLGKLQSAYSDEVGRTVMLNDKSLEALTEIATATSLGVEGSAQIAANLETQGKSAEATRDFIQESMKSSYKMGLNANKVLKNMSSGIKLLDRYNFKEGNKGLDRMAKTVTKLGVGMEFAAGFADKLFDIEGAVDMSAQLQVMGGAWANLADPFKLAYMARNDMAGLTEELGKATEASVKFNKTTGEFEISAYELDKLRHIANQTGASLDDLVTAGKKARKATEIKSQVGFDLSPEMKEFLTNTAEFKDGKAVIDVEGDGVQVMVSQLTKAQQETLKTRMLEEKTLKERAKASQNFDDKLTNLINMFKTTMLPIVDGINDVLGPLVDDVLNNKKFMNELHDLGKSIGQFVKGGAEIVKYLAEAAVNLGPKGILATYLGGKALGFLYDKWSWIQNGQFLAMGFRTGMAGGGVGAGGAGGGISSMGAMRNGGNWMKAGGYAIAGQGVGMLTDWGSQKAKDSGHTGLGKGIGVLGKSAEYALYGAAIGSLIPVLGTTIGAVAGGIIGAGKGLYDQYYDNEPVNNPNYTRGMHDGVVHGNNFSKGRGVIQNGTITPIDNKDDLIAYKPNGPIDKASKNTTPSVMKIEFGEIHFKFDDLLIKSDAGPGKSIDVLDNPTFIRNLTSMIHSETQKAINGGLVKG